MGSHHGFGKAKDPRGAYAHVGRALAATSVLAVSVYALNLSSTVQEVRPALSSAAVADARTGGSTATGNRDFGQQSRGPSGVVLPAPGSGEARPFPGALAADPHALVPFPRPSVGTFGQDKAAVLVGLLGVNRPPAGYLMAPLLVLNPSSPYGYRISPLTGEAGDFHLGQDYSAACGTTVYAADSGVVRAAGWHPWGGGNRVEIDHGNGLITTYNHLESIAVSSGDTVHVGQAIAQVGSTGWSTGCHLHFETILNGRHTSPLNWELLPARALTGSEPTGLRSYLPGSGASTGGTTTWTLPDGGSGTPLVAATTADASPSTTTASSTPSASSPAVPSTSTTTASPTAPPTTTSPTSPPPTTSTPPATTAPPTATSPTSPPQTTTPPPSTTAPPATTPPATTAPAPAEPAPLPTAPAPVATPVEPAPAAPTLIDPTPTPTPELPAPTATTPPPSEPAPTTTTPAPSDPATLLPTIDVTVTDPALAPTPTPTGVIP